MAEIVTIAHGDTLTGILKRKRGLNDGQIYTCLLVKRSASILSAFHRFDTDTDANGVPPFLCFFSILIYSSPTICPSTMRCTIR